MNARKGRGREDEEEATTRRYHETVPSSRALKHTEEQITGENSVDSYANYLYLEINVSFSELAVSITVY